LRKPIPPEDDFEEIDRKVDNVRVKVEVEELIKK